MVIMAISTAVTSQLDVVNSSNPETQGNSTSIGEYVQFGVIVTLPRGTTDTLSIVFKLPVSQGLLSLENVTVINQPANIVLSSMSVILGDSNNDRLNDTASVNIPSVVNNPGTTSNITVVFTALVQVSSRNTNGLQLVATSILSYSNGTAQFPETTRSATITVVTPALSMSVVYETSTGDAGDIIGCRVTISHSATSSGAAYAINLGGLLAPYLHLVSGSVSSNVTTSAAPTSSDSAVDGIAYLPVLLLGVSASLRFNVYLDNAVSASSVISVKLVANYSSSPVGEQSLNLNRSISNSYDISISPAPVTSLVLLNTSIPSANASIVNVGELATFSLTLTIPEGVTNGVSISIFTSAPSGAFVIKSVSLVAPGNIVANSLSIQIADGNGDNRNETALVTATSLVNTPIIYNDAVQLVISCVPEAPVADGTIFSVNSVFSYYGNFGKQLITEPAKRTDVTISVPTVNVTQLCSPLLGDAQDKISCTVKVSNSANLPLYSVLIGNSFEDDTYIQIVAGSIVTNVGTVVNGAVLTDTNFSVFAATFNPTQAVPIMRVTYLAVLSNLAESGTQLNLDTFVSYLSSPSAYETPNVKRVTTTVTVKSPTIAITCPTSSLTSTTGFAGAIGEMMNFMVTITLAEGMTKVPTLVITTAPSHSILSSNVLSLGNSGICAPFPRASMKAAVVGVNNQVTFTFADLCNNGDNKATPADQITISMSTIILNNPSNVVGGSLPVTATLSYGRSLSVTQIEPVILVEPSVQLDITAIPSGNNFRYNISVSHLQGSSGWAYNLKISSTLAPSLQIVAGTAKSNAAGTVSTTNNVISFTIAQMNFAQSYYVTFNATSTASPGTDITTTAIVNYQSLSTTTNPNTNARISLASDAVMVTIGSSTTKRAIPQLEDPNERRSVYSYLNPIAWFKLLVNK